MGASNSEEQRLTATPSSEQDTTPDSEACDCGKAAYGVAKNKADAYLKEEGQVSVATQYFNNVEDKKNNKKQGNGDGKHEGVIGKISRLFGN
eukprot:CAMPEP_0196144110 /NCGR_PEP_ID=MMETSP0910-20130528/15115_1 /TAXON_ID=49265 /ORGANISM="Thalassiosira rotula, Strain GSO102" /LENGTH=91 /DNA_ID=CAMNT_0041405687 /DNA_START=148 /DNA_END=423 /DNA_ORIENTATION=-